MKAVICDLCGRKIDRSKSRPLGVIPAAFTNYSVAIKERYGSKPVRKLDVCSQCVEDFIAYAKMKKMGAIE